MCVLCLIGMCPNPNLKWGEMLGGKLGVSVFFIVHYVCDEVSLLNLHSNIVGLNA